MAIEQEQETDEQQPIVNETDDGVVIEHDDDTVVQETAEMLAEESMNAGFERISDDHGIDAPLETDDDQDDLQAELEALRSFKNEATERLDKATQKIQSLEGFKGSIKQQINHGVKKALEEMNLSPGGGGAPSQEEIDAAMVDSDALNSLIEEYPSFAPMAKAIESMNARIDKLGSATPPQESQPASEPTDGPDFSQLDEFHPGWRQTVDSDNFKDYVLEGGPIRSDYNEVVADFRSGDPDRIAIAGALVEGWVTAMPEWWESTGKRLFGGPDASKTLLDEYADRGKEPKNDQQNDAKDGDDQEIDDLEAQKNSSRKERIHRTAAPPKTRGGVPATGLNDNEAFEAGFNKVNKANRR